MLACNIVACLELNTGGIVVTFHCCHEQNTQLQMKPNRLVRIPKYFRVGSLTKLVRMC